MDNIIWLPFFFIVARFAYIFYIGNIKRGAKISDGQLMQNYIIRTQKINNKNYFPNMTIKGDF